MSKLTSREKEVLECVGVGCSNRQIAAELGVSVHTVRKHRSNILTKLSLNSTVQLLAYAVRGASTVPLKTPAVDHFSELTAREKQVVALIAQGNTGKQVARKLNISPGTVRKHRANIAKRAGLRSLADIISRATKPEPR